MTLKIHSTEAERLTEYRICQERGHDSECTICEGVEKWQVCRHCGTHFQKRLVTSMTERNKPEGAE